MNCIPRFFLFCFFKFSSKVHSLLFVLHGRILRGVGGAKFKIRQRTRIRWKSLVHFFRGINLLFTGTTSCLVSNCSLEASPLNGAILSDLSLLTKMLGAKKHKPIHMRISFSLSDSSLYRKLPAAYLDFSAAKIE